MACADSFDLPNGEEDERNSEDDLFSLKGALLFSLP